MPLSIGTVRYGNVSANAGGADLTPAHPSSVAEGELLVVWVYSRGTAVTFSLAGWTPLDSAQTANGSWALFWKKAAGGESGTVTVTQSGGSGGSSGTAQLARMMAIPNAQNAGTITSGSINKETEASGGTITNVGVSPTHAGSLICLFTGKGDGGNNTTNDFSGWAGNSLTWAGVANGTTNGGDAAIGIGTAVKADTGGTGNLTCSNTLNFVGVSVALALRPLGDFAEARSDDAAATDSAGAILDDGRPLIDSSFPVYGSKSAIANFSSIATPSFTPGGTDRLLVALFILDGGDAINEEATLSGGGLTWTRKDRVTDDGGFGVAEVWTAWCASPSSMAVTMEWATATPSGSAVLAVYSLDRASQTIGDTGVKFSLTAATVDVTLSVGGADRLLLGAFKHGTDANGLTADSNTAWDIDFRVPGSASSLAVGRYVPATTGAGSITFGATDSEDHSASVGIEIAPDSGPQDYPENPSDTGVATQATGVSQGFTVGASDDAEASDTSTASQAQTASGSDTAEAEGTATPAKGQVVAGADTGEATDAATISQGQSAAPADTGEATDSAGVSASTSAAPVDDGEATDAAANSQGTAAAGSDTAEATDAATQTQGQSAAGSDAAVAGGSADIAGSSSEEVTDDAAAEGTASASQAQSASPVDDAAVADAASDTTGLSGDADASDSVEAIRDAPLSGADDAGATDSSTIRQGHGVATASDAEATDSAISSRGTAASGTDSGVATDSATHAQIHTETTTHPPTSNSQSATPWTNPQNGYSDDTAHATCSPAQNTTVEGTWDGFNLGSIPSNATILSAHIDLLWTVSSFDTTTLGAQATVGGVDFGSEVTRTGGSTYTTFNSDAIPLTNITRAELDQLAVKVRASRAGGSTNFTAYLDALTLSVEWQITVSTVPAAHAQDNIEAGDSATAGRGAVATGADDAVATDSATARVDAAVAPADDAEAAGEASAQVAATVAPVDTGVATDSTAATGDSTVGATDSAAAGDSAQASAAGSEAPVDAAVATDAITTGSSAAGSDTAVAAEEATISVGTRHDATAAAEASDGAAPQVAASVAAEDSGAAADAAQLGSGAGASDTVAAGDGASTQVASQADELTEIAVQDSVVAVKSSALDAVGRSATIEVTGRYLATTLAMRSTRTAKITLGVRRSLATTLQIGA